MAFARDAWLCAAFSTEVDASLLGRNILGEGVLMERLIAEEATQTARHSVKPAKAASVRAIPA